MSWGPPVGMQLRTLDVYPNFATMKGPTGGTSDCAGHVNPGGPGLQARYLQPGAPVKVVDMQSALGSDMVLRPPEERPNQGRKVRTFNVATSHELLANAIRAVRAGECRSTWHVLCAELDTALTQRSFGQVNEVRWAMLQLVREELAGQLPLPGQACPRCNVKIGTLRNGRPCNRAVCNAED